MTGRIFISYRRRHAADVDAIAQALTLAGVDVFIDREQIDQLDDFPSKLQAAIHRSHAMLVWWSADYANSPVCLDELRLAWRGASHAAAGERIWIVNPEQRADHIHGGVLGRQSFLSIPRPEEMGMWAAQLARRLSVLVDEGTLEDLAGRPRAARLIGAPAVAPGFTGRASSLMELHTELFPVTLREMRRPGVRLWGMGGTGKSALAAAYAEEFADSYPAGIWWIDLAAWQPDEPLDHAAARQVWAQALLESVSRSDAVLASRLGTGPEGQACSPEELRERWGSYVESLSNGPGGSAHLVVLNDWPVVSPVPERDEILVWMAGRAPGGRLLLTTRDGREAAGLDSLHLGALDPGDGRRLLARGRSPLDDGDRAAIEAIVDEVGGHAQSLMLLAEHARFALDGWPQLLERLRGAQAMQQIETAAVSLQADLGTRARGIVATFRVAIESLDAPTQDALRLACMCAPQIPLVPTLLSLAWQPADTAEHDLTQALRALARSSLLDQGSETHGAIPWQVHPVAVLAARHLLGGDWDESRRALCLAAHALLIDREDSGALTALAALLPHARQVAMSLAGADAIAVLLDVADVHGRAGRPAVAAGIESVALARCRAEAPEAVELRLRAQRYLANSWCDLGRLGAARSAAVSTLAEARACLGNEHPVTLECADSLAEVAWQQDDLASVRTLTEEVVAGRRRLLGDEDARTLMSLGNLASLLADEGDYEAALALQEDVVERTARLLVRDHGQTLQAAMNLASKLADRGEFRRSARLLEPTVRGLERRLGPQHPTTLIAQVNLATSYANAGQTELARPLLHLAMETLSRQFGDDHPALWTAQTTWSDLLLNDGQTTAAVALLRKVHRAQSVSLGAGHRATFATAQQLALALAKGGAPAEAYALLAQVLAEARQTFSAAHPFLLSLQVTQAGILRAAGRPAESVELVRAALDSARSDKSQLPRHLHLALQLELTAGLIVQQLTADAARVLDEVQSDPDLPEQLAQQPDLAIHIAQALLLAGLDNFDWLLEPIVSLEASGLSVQRRRTALRILGHSKHRRGEVVASSTIRREALRLHAETLGEDADETRECRTELALSLMEAGRFDEAERLFRAVLEAVQSGSNCEAIAMSKALGNLGVLLNRTGRSVEAARLHRQAYALRLECLGENDTNTRLSLQNLTAAVIAARTQTNETVLGSDSNGALDAPPSEVLAEQLLAFGHPDLALEEADRFLFLMPDDAATKLSRRSLRVLEVILRSSSALDRHSTVIELSPVVRRLQEMHLEPGTPQILDVLNLSAKACIRLGRMAEALPLVQLCVSGQRALMGPMHRDTLAEEQNLAEVLWQLNRRQEAVEQLTGTVRRLYEQFGVNDVETQQAGKRLMEMLAQRGWVSRLADWLPRRRNKS